MNYEELEAEYKRLKDINLSVLIKDMAALMVAESEGQAPKEETDEERHYKTNKEFVCNVQILKVLTKLYQIRHDKYKEELDHQIEIVEKEIEWRYIGSSSKKKYDRVIIFRILLGEDYSFWAERIENKNKFILKKIAEINAIMYWTLTWAEVGKKEHFNEYSKELLLNAIDILSSEKRATPKMIQDLMVMKNTI